MRIFDRRWLVLCFCVASAVKAQDQSSAPVPICEVLANLDKLNHATMRIQGDLIIDETDQALRTPDGCGTPIIRGGWVWRAGLGLDWRLTRKISYAMTDAARDEAAKLAGQGVQRIRHVVVITCRLEVPTRYQKTPAGWAMGLYPASIAVVEVPIEIMAVEAYTDEQYQRYRDERKTFHAVPAGGEKRKLKLRSWLGF